MSDTDRLLREVFTLAYHLKWSRDDILALPVPERRRYLELLREQLEREAESVGEEVAR
jgi:Family of unknown function (DUF6760)